MSSPKGQRPLPDQSFGPDAVHLEEKAYCFYCGRQMTRWGMEFSVDHVTPKSRGGPDAPGNRVPCCITCNRAKGNKHWSEFVCSLPLVRQQQLAIALKDHDEQFPFAGRKQKPSPKRQKEPKPRPAKIPKHVNERAGLAAKSMAENILRQSGEPRGKDVTWFKARISDAKDLLKDGRVFEAALLLDAVGSLETSFRPGLDPEGAAELVEQRRTRNRPFLEALFSDRGLPRAIDVTPFGVAKASNQ